jgi:citrate lyase subunit beta-like protein
MAKAYASQKGAVGLDLGDEEGHKEMIDAPMLKQVTLVGLFINSFI